MWNEQRDSWLLETSTRYLHKKHTTQPKYGFHVYPRLKVLAPYDKIHREKPVLKNFGNIKDGSVTRVKQNIAREQLANFVIGLLVKWAPCQLLVSHWTTQLFQVFKTNLISRALSCSASLALGGLEDERPWERACCKTWDVLKKQSNLRIKRTSLFSQTCSTVLYQAKPAGPQIQTR